MMDKIAIFCSASENIEPVFFEKARELGVWMGQNKKTLVYGGANIGLMECIAKAAKDNGSMIMGVIPTKLEERGRASDLVDVTFRTDNLSDRKDVMLNESDVVIALPGGVGTLDEVFHEKPHPVYPLLPAKLSLHPIHSTSHLYGHSNYLYGKSHPPNRWLVHVLPAWSE